MGDGSAFVRIEAKSCLMKDASLSLLIFILVSAPFAVSSENGGLFQVHKYPSFANNFEDKIHSIPSHWTRTLKQAAAPSPSNNASFILAASQTRRPDPLDNFHKYVNGWDIRNNHYWASVGYTGLPGFAIAALWLAFGLLFFVCLCCWWCCCSSQIRDYSKHGCLVFWLPFFLLFLLTCAAILGCALVYISQGKFHDTLSHTLDYVVNQSEYTVENLRNVSNIMAQAATVSIGPISIPADEKASIQQESRQLNSSADQLESETDNNSHRIRRAINLVRLVMIIEAGVMLLLALLGLLLVSCGFRPPIYMLVFVGWFLVAATWILCGVFILLNNAMGDTCVAMQEWILNPKAHTNLDEIIPCVDEQTANQTLLQSKNMTLTIVNVVDQAISLTFNVNPPPGTPLYFNQSGPLVPLLCSPYGPSPDFKDISCPAGQVDLNNALGNWSDYICTSSNGNCTSQGRLTQDIYNELVKAVTIANGLRVNVPFLISVENCEFVRITFQTVVTNYCPNLRKYTKWVWSGLALTSGGSMLAIVFWLICIRKHPRRDPKYAQLIT